MLLLTNVITFLGRSFEQVVRPAKAKYRPRALGHSARKDGHHPVVFMQCGPVRHRSMRKFRRPPDRFTHYFVGAPTSFHPSTRVARSGPTIQFQGFTGNCYRRATLNPLDLRGRCRAVHEALAVVLTERERALGRTCRTGFQPCFHIWWSCAAEQASKKAKSLLAMRWNSIPENDECDCACDRTAISARVRRCTARHTFPHTAGFLARDECPVRRPLHRRATANARCASLRLRRPERADVVAHVRPPLPRL